MSESDLPLNVVLWRLCHTRCFFVNFVNMGVIYRRMPQNHPPFIVERVRTSSTGKCCLTALAYFAFSRFHISRGDLEFHTSRNGYYSNREDREKNSNNRSNTWGRWFDLANQVSPSQDTSRGNMIAFTHFRPLWPWFFRSARVLLIL